MTQKVAYDKLPIYTTDVRPGFVRTAMAKADKMFWISSKEKAARQIFRSIYKKKKNCLHQSTLGNNRLDSRAHPLVNIQTHVRIF